MRDEGGARRVKPYYEFHATEVDGTMALYVSWQDGKYGQDIGEVADSVVADKEVIAKVIVDALNANEELRAP